MRAASAIPANARPAPMSRWKASAIHFLASAGIAVAIAVLMLMVWYPWPLFEVAGGGGLAMILVGVGVVPGPLLTLIIFKAGKKGLKFDLMVIVLAQLSALAYGLHIVYLARPAYIVYNVDRFDLVAAVQLDPQDLAQATREEFRSPPADGPKYVAAVLPGNPDEQRKILDSALQGKDLHLFPQHYVAYEQEAQNALRRAKTIGALIERDSSGAVGRYIESTGRSQESVKFLPLRARNGDATVLLDAASGKPLKIVLVDPW
jgi:hypothetical protein